MATATVPPRTVSSPTHRNNLGLASAWGGVLLVIMACWLHARSLPLSVVLATGLLALAGLLLGCWPLLTYRRWRRLEAEVQEASLQFLRRLLGWSWLVIGCLLLVLGAGLGWSERLQAFGEATSLGVFGLIAACSGRWLLLAPATPSRQEKILEALLGLRAHLGLLALVLGVGLGGLGVYLRWKGLGTFPFWTGAILLGALSLAAGGWLVLSAPAAIGPSTMRVLLLLWGGLAGLVISLLTLGLAWAWRDQTLFGGMAAWTGTAAWKIWLCAYLELFGLALMFGSFLLGRSEVRASVAVRRVLYGYNAVLTGLLLLAFLVVLNIFVYVVYPLNFDWTEGRGLYALSTSSQDVLSRLKEPAKVYVLLSQNFKVFKDVRNLLDNCQSLTDQLTVEYVNPDRDLTRYQTLANKFSELPNVRQALEEDQVGRGLLLVYGSKEDDPKKRRLIPMRSLYKEDFRDDRRVLEFQGESALMSDLRFLMAGQKKAKIYFLQGDGELDVTHASPHPKQDVSLVQSLAPLGAGRWLDRLQKDNQEAVGLSFDNPEPGKKEIVYAKENEKTKKKEVPDDAAVVVVAGPSKKLPQETLDALERYLERTGDNKGRMMILFDVFIERGWTGFVKTGLEELLKKYHVEVGNDFVFNYSRQPLNALVTTAEGASTILAKQFRAEVYPLKLVRVVRPLPAKGPGGFKAEELLVAETDPNLYAYWPENDLAAIRDPDTFRFQLTPLQLRDKIQRTVPVGVTVQDSADEPRLVVLGDADFASNLTLFSQRELREGLAAGDTYYNFLASSLDWLTKRPGIGMKPKETFMFTLGKEGLDQVSSGRMFLLPAWLMLISIVGLGIGMWVVRRR